MKDSKGNAVSAAKGAKLEVLAEKTLNGVKWFQVQAEISGNRNPIPGNTPDANLVQHPELLIFFHQDNNAAVGRSFFAHIQLIRRNRSRILEFLLLIHRNVTKANGNVLTIPEGSLVSIESETTVSGEKWFRVSAEVDGKTYTGYTPASKLALAAKPAPDPTPSPSPPPTPTVNSHQLRAVLRLPLKRQRRHSLNGSLPDHGQHRGRGRSRCRHLGRPSCRGRDLFCRLRRLCRIRLFRRGRGRFFCRRRISGWTAARALTGSLTGEL